MMRRDIQVAGAVALVGAMLLSLAACNPPDVAVRDTHASASSSASSGVQRSDISIGVVGSTDDAVGRSLLDAYASRGLSASYVSVESSRDTVRAAQQGVRDMAARAVSVIVVVGMDATADTQGWDAALRNARESGIPVILVTPRHAPSDEGLYAATFTVAGSVDPQALDEATVSVINDCAHARRIAVGEDSR